MITNDDDLSNALDELNKLHIELPKSKTSHGINKKTQPKNESPFYSIDQIIKIIPVSKVTLYRMIARGDFPAPIKLSSIARGSFWNKEKVQAWIDEKLKE